MPIRSHAQAFDVFRTVSGKRDVLPPIAAHGFGNPYRTRCHELGRKVPAGRSHRQRLLTGVDMSPEEQQELVEVAGELADAAGPATLRHFRLQGLEHENKDAMGWDPVTDADRESEMAMRKILARRRPQDAIQGEEFNAVDGTSGLTWVLDPIDGTRSFVSGSPVWGILIAISDKSGPLYGIVEQPYIGERFEGGFGRATARGPLGTRQISTRKTKDLADAILFTTFPEIGTVHERRAFENLSRQTLLTRYGMDCYGYALLAGGHIDLVVEAGLKDIDINAPIAVVQAAGGMVTGWDGGPAHLGGRIVAAANQYIHEAALEFLSSCP